MSLVVKRASQPLTRPCPQLLVLSLGCAAALRAEAPAKTTSLPAALRLRGGVSSETIVSVGAGLTAASGLLSYISPKTNLAAYKIPASLIDDTALGAMRAVGCWQLALTALLLAEPSKALAVSLFCPAAAIFLSIPAYEAFGTQKASAVVWVGILSALGKLGLDGKLPNWVAPALFLVNGAQFFFTPSGAMSMYKAAKMPSALGLSMVTLQGTMMLGMGAYVTALAAGLTHMQAFGIAWIINGALAAKWAVTEAPKFNTPKAGPLAWSAISAVIAGLALK